MKFKVLFVDVGGVLLTNGWDTELRHKTAAHFSLDPKELQERHEMIFDDFECGKCSFDEYLHHVIFFQARPFSLETFKAYVLESSRPFPKAIEWIKSLKAQNQAKLVVLSNEGREIAEYRFNTFRFHEFVDFYVVSSFVGLRKPDPRIYKLALDLCQEKAQDVLYIDDRSQYFEIAKNFGIQTLHHLSRE
jgi:putative hydrolase of the HAD superfamily